MLNRYYELRPIINCDDFFSKHKVDITIQCERVLTCGKRPLVSPAACARTADALAVIGKSLGLRAAAPTAGTGYGGGHGGGHGLGGAAALRGGAGGCAAAISARQLQREQRHNVMTKKHWSRFNSLESQPTRLLKCFHAFSRTLDRNARTAFSRPDNRRAQPASLAASFHH